LRDFTSKSAVIVVFSASFCKGHQISTPAPLSEPKQA
jgi:hypothetical protein